jgi:hypothetical protein
MAFDVAKTPEIRELLVGSLLCVGITLLSMLNRRTTGIVQRQLH